ncbi:hypothetical protein QBC40DRAFT_315605 [Triangularia verruculosa]|uniref:Uncharacterized protein n=1 Tax=Triangularia verruculosa TaxID=2587418 RepID=A0AAN6X9X3_9PEZI|nr:hypothetical protein QBC40DRAFT_315605 [Triangularia verruculosa]
MSDNKSTQPAAPEGFSEREQRLMMFVLLHSDITSLAIDYPAVAGRMGLTNVRSASNAWGALKKKILAIDAKDKAANPERAAAAAEESTATTSKTPAKAAAKTPAKGKRSAAVMAEGDADGEVDALESPTPTKKARGRKPKAAATPKAEGGEDAPIDLITPTPKKALRGRAAAKAKAEAAKAAAEKAAAAVDEEEDSSEVDVTMSEAKFAPVKSDDEDVEELINPDDVAELEKIAAAGVKAIKEEEDCDDDEGII